MPAPFSDPIREILNRIRGKCYIGDLLTQSISLCFGFWILETKEIEALGKGPRLQEDFDRAVLSRLNEANSGVVGLSYREFSQCRLPEEVFQELFRHWMSFSTDKERLVRLTERLIYPNFSRVYRSAQTVPGWLERLSMELLPPVGGTFYDGTAGGGGMAIRIAQDRQEKELPLQVITGEAEPLLFHLSVLRAEMHGLRFQQTMEDCLHSHRPPIQADLSVMFPPLRGGQPIPVSDSLLCGSDWSYAYHQLNCLSETGVGVCRIPNGALFNSKNLAFREYLLGRNVLDAVIALPKNSAPFSPTAPATALVVFRRGRKRGDAVRMAELPPPSPAGTKNGSGVISYSLSRSLLPIIEANSVMLPPSELSAENLSPQWYLPNPQRGGGEPEAPAFLPERGDKNHPAHGSVHLMEVARIYRGINVAGLSRSQEGAGILRLSDVQNSRICMGDISRYDLSGRDRIQRYQICRGDILLSCKGKAIKLCLVSEDSPLLLSHDFLGIRPDPSKMDSQYLFYVLQSPVGQRSLQQLQMGSSIVMIRASDLELMPLHYIPLLSQTRYAAELQAADEHIEKQLASLNESRQRAYAQFYQKTGMEDSH